MGGSEPEERSMPSKVESAPPPGGKGPRQCDNAVAKLEVVLQMPRRVGSFRGREHKFYGQYLM